MLARLCRLLGVAAVTAVHKFLWLFHAISPGVPAGRHVGIGKSLRSAIISHFAPAILLRSPSRHTSVVRATDATDCARLRLGVVAADATALCERVKAAVPRPPIVLLRVKLRRTPVTATLGLSSVTADRSISHGLECASAATAVGEDNCSSSARLLQAGDVAAICLNDASPDTSVWQQR